MNCCIHCFTDSQLCKMIEKRGLIGDCNFCESKNVNVYPIGEESDLTDLLAGVLELYEKADEGSPIWDVLCKDWNIFSGTPEIVKLLVEAVCSTLIASDCDKYTSNVCIPRQTIEEFGIFGGLDWLAFSETIKSRNRFHSGYFNAGLFASFLSYPVKNYPAGTILMRARISTDNKGFSITEMGAPPRGRRSAGRINPEGIGVLYLASDRDTVLNEVRASAFDYVTIGHFKSLRDIRVVDLSGMHMISPFIYESGLAQFAANLTVFNDIAKEIAKPLRRSDSPLEYLPTQYITEFIKSQEYDGVQYASTMRTGGYNVAVFDEGFFECIETSVVEVRKLNYDIEDIA